MAEGPVFFPHSDRRRVPARRTAGPAPRFGEACSPTDVSLTYEVYGQFFDPLTPATSISKADDSVGAPRFLHARWLVDRRLVLRVHRNGQWNQLGGPDAF